MADIGEVDWSMDTEESTPPLAAKTEEKVRGNVFKVSFRVQRPSFIQTFFWGKPKNAQLTIPNLSLPSASFPPRRKEIFLSAVSVLIGTEDAQKIFKSKEIARIQIKLKIDQNRRSRTGSGNDFSEPDTAL